MISKGNKKLINAWAMYDWANSVYSLVITSTIFPAYFIAVTTFGDTDKVSFFGREYINSSLYSYALSFSFLIIAALSPLLSSIADYTGKKKGFMQFFCYLGSISCASMFFFTGDRLEFGIIASMLASIGFAGSIVFYNAYLPEIAAVKDQDKVSAKGYAMGYIGSVLLLIICLILIERFDLFGVTDKGIATRLTFIITGIWWAGFAQITFRKLPKNIYNRKPEGNIYLKGYQELRKVWKQLSQHHFLKTFLFAFFFYSIGVQTVMLLASTFSKKELALEDSQLIITILIIQIVAIGGAYLSSALSSKIGNIRTLRVIVVIWIGICIGAYFTYTATQFFIVAACVGIVMGGIQSLSRSTYSKYLPETQDHASFFSFYDVSEKVAIVLGTASFGLIEELTGSMRNSILVLTIFFSLGLISLLFIRKTSQ